MIQLPVNLKLGLMSKCKICKKSFISHSKWEVNSKWYKCCSRRCADLSRRKRVKIKCKKCKKYFEIPQSIKIYSNPNFCSWKCRYGHIKQERKINKCLICKKNTKNKKYCSKRCMGENYKGRNNPSWRNGVSKLPYDYKFNRKLKELIRKRDKMICQLCHHIDRDKQNSKSKNLILLCNSCNAKMNIIKGYKIYQKLFEDLVKKNE